VRRSPKRQFVGERPRIHCSLNAAWSVFDLSGAGGGWGWISHLLRFACAVVAVIVLWRIKGRRGKALDVKRIESA